MKRIITLGLAIMIAFATTAQTGHLTFKGVPIDGTLNEFVGKLKQKGLTQIGKDKGVAILEGEFAAFKGCTIGVYEHESGLVNRVGVMFPKRDTWSMLYSDYSKLKEMLTQKYGEPSDVTEEFQGYSTPRTDGDKMYAVEFDRCKYVCDFTTEEGLIEL